jgi:hypothetical protein
MTEQYIVGVADEVPTGPEDVDALRRQLAELQQQLRRTELKLQGSRRQVELLVTYAPEGGELLESSLATELAASQARVAELDRQIEALFNTKTMRLLRAPRDAYARIRARRGARR